MPGNHELWTRAGDPVALRGEDRYEHLVSSAARSASSPRRTRSRSGRAGGPAVVAPLFLLYDYSFLPEGTATAEEGLAAAYRAGVVCTDEHLLAPDPYPTAPRGARPGSRTRATADACDPACRRCWSTTGR